MRAMQVEPNGHTYLAIFNVYKISRDVDGAKLAWQDMRAAGVRPIAPAVSAVMSAVAKTGDIQATQAMGWEEGLHLPNFFQCSVSLPPNSWFSRDQLSAPPLKTRPCKATIARCHSPEAPSYTQQLR